MPISLSEAIREGAKLRPQAFGFMFNKRDGVWCSCALGAAREYVFGTGPGTATTSANDVTALAQQCDVDLSQCCTDPQEQTFTMLHTIILRLNDEYHWTREQIADWLQTIGQ